jgi:hypothetical protein
VVSQVTVLLDKYEAKAINHAELLDGLASLRYGPRDMGPRWEDPASVDWQSDFPVEGTTDELDWAEARGRLSLGDLKEVYRRVGVAASTPVR